MATTEDNTNNDTPGERLTIRNRDDLNDVSSRITTQQIETVVSLINEDRVGDSEAIVWLPEFIADDRRFTPVTGTEQLYIGTVDDYSDDAWAFRQDDGEEPEFLPKSWTVVFDPDTNGRIETKQHSLTSWS